MFLALPDTDHEHIGKYDTGGRIAAATLSGREVPGALRADRSECRESALRLQVSTIVTGFDNEAERHCSGTPADREKSE